VRICSLNEKKKNIVAECNTDKNIPPNKVGGSPKIITLKQKSPQENKKLEENTAEETPKVRHHSLKTAADRVIENEEEFDKLLEITSRCVDYYNKFTEEKEAETRIVREAFIEIHSTLNTVFNGIITEVLAKQIEIKSFLEKKELELIRIKEQQETDLNSSLTAIKSVHLANLLRDFRLSEEPANVEHELCSYANTLHTFYWSMEKVEQCNFRENLEETINFINNVISEEIRFIMF
jgi:hypothetical protein